MRLVECVANFSEGRDRAVLDAIADAIRGVEGVELLAVDPGRATNRTVFTFVGAPEAAAEAAFRAVEAAAQRIDMRRLPFRFHTRHSRRHARVALRQGGLANAPGCGVADDKVIYTYVPEIIRYYLQEEPILPNVPSYRCVDKTERDYVLERIDTMVVKPANESGGYGVLIGPKASKAEREKFSRQILANPRNYMAQPMLKLSTAPTLVETHAEPRHLDLRPFILTGEHSYVTAGGLTRVALTKGSLVVNSDSLKRAFLDTYPAPDAEFFGHNCLPVLSDNDSLVTCPHTGAVEDALGAALPRVAPVFVDDRDPHDRFTPSR